MKKIAIITPLKNEIENIKRLVHSISEQTIYIDTWIIVENGSTDGSRELLSEIDHVANVKNFKVVNFSLPNEKYELGVKYATVVNVGFEQLRSSGYIEQLDYLGILDADCFPPSNYYSELTSHMDADDSLGISSGLAYNEDGRYDGKAKSWPRGNCRLWKASCFLECGYYVGPSADALSVSAAELKGWQCEAARHIQYTCREVGKKVDYKYYGKSAHFRGIPPTYAALKSLVYLLKLKPRKSLSYFLGYFESFLSKQKKIDNTEIQRYNRQILSRKLLALLRTTKP